MKLIIIILLPLICFLQNVIGQVSYATSQTTYVMYGLSTDTKPINPPDNCLFIETNTGKNYFSISNNWKLAQNLSVLPNVTNIATSYTLNNNTLLITDSIRGGTFFLYNGTDTADNGIIFQDGLNRKWRRQYEPSTISSAWYGMIADDVTDQLPILKRIISIMNSKALQTTGGYNYYRDSRTLFIPGSNNYYYFSDSILLPNTITIRGEGAYQNITTKFLFPAHKTGIATQPIDTSYYTNTVGTVIENITVHQYVTAPYDTTKHGFNITSKVHLINCFADGWEGDGFHIEAPINGNGGNADLAILDNCSAYNCFNGLFIKGADATLIRVNNFNATANARWGVWDKGFLGNLYENCHVASSCINPRQRSFAKNAGLEYYAKHDGILSQPGVAVGWQNDWVLVGDTTHFLWGLEANYNASTYYLVGGAYAIDLQNPNVMSGGENAYASLIGCYSESDQPPSYIGQRSIVISGDMGAGYYNTVANLIANNNQLVTTSSISAGTQNLTSASTLAQGYVQTISSNGGVRWGYNSTSKTGYIQELGANNQPLQIVTSTTVAADYGRSTLIPGNLINTYGAYIGRLDDATQIRYLGLSSTRPSTGTWSAGDFVIKTATSTSDTLGWRCITGGTPGTWQAIPPPLSYTPVNNTTTVNGHALSGNVSVTASDVGLGNVTNESKGTMFTSPTFTGTTSGITAAMVGLGNVTNESKATMFTNATFTGTFTAPNGVITNAMLGGSIAYSKLVLTGAILNADLAGSIAASKLIGSDITTVGTITSGTWNGTAITSLGVATGTSLATTGLITSSSVSAGIGYATGAGLAVSQATSKSTGVTINSVSGAITTNNAALAAGVEVKFTVTDSRVAATDVPVIAIKSGGTSGAYAIEVSAVSAGSFDITITNLSAGSLSEAIVISFVIIKAVAN